MRTAPAMHPALLPLAALTLPAILLVFATRQEGSAFSSKTIDVGMVVSDIDAAAEFYGKVIGFTEAPGFDVPAELCTAAGLTDHKPLLIRVFVLGEGEGATKIKLMEVVDTKPKQSDNAFIHSQLGLSYLTVFVSDLSTVEKRLAEAGVKILSTGPVPLGEGAAAPQLALVRDPDGNLVELIGPRL